MNLLAKPLAVLTVLLAGTTALFSAPKSGPLPQKPNIIFFLVDDMGWQDTSLPFWHDREGKPVRTFLNKRYKTPHMEELARQGMMFTSAYAQPICSPSRVSLMSGMNSSRHRVTNWTLKQDQSTDAGSRFVRAPEGWNVNGLQPEGTKPSGKTTRPITGEKITYEMKKPYVTATSLPSLLKKQGYVTIHCGKAHFGTRGTPGADPKNFGFDYNIAGTEIGGPADYRGGQKYGQGDFRVCGLDENNYYQDDTFLTEALTLEALKRLDAIRANPAEAKKPFYLYMAHYAIHVPIDQRGYDKRFADHYTNPGDGHKWNDSERNYSGLIEGMDKSLGDIMAYLKKNNLEDNTVLVFMSDNGGLAEQANRLGNREANYPLSYGKGSGYEGGIREPMIVRWPKATRPGSRCDVPVIMEDFFPTLMEIAGAKKLRTEQTIDGKSFASLLAPGAKPSKAQLERPLLFHVPNVWTGDRQGYQPFTAMRKGDWKLIYDHASQGFNLYNLADDISEQNNLADENPGKLKELATVMSALLKERKAQMPLYKKDNTVGAAAGSTVPLPDQVVAKKF